MSVDTNRFQPLSGAGVGYLAVVLLLLVLSALGGYCAYVMQHEGHHITGMNNQIVWGLPHVFAVSLILAASGALNGATLATVFAVSAYKPYARLSIVLAVCLLVGGLLVLALDLGRPDRLIIAMTHYNFRSIFSWNIILYTGFIVIAVVYLSVMLERRFNQLHKTVGVVALAWRIILTTGTGCIFGFLVGRSAFDSGILALLFIVLSFVIGTAALALVMMLINRWQQHLLPVDCVQALSRLLCGCILALLFVSTLHYLANLSAAQSTIDQNFILPGPHVVPFWVGHVGIGILLPLLLLRWQKRKPHQLSSVSSVAASAKFTGAQSTLMYACIAALLGGTVLVYVVIIGVQSRPKVLFPDHIITASSFADAAIAGYLPALWEWGLGIGGVSAALLLLCIALRIFPVSAEPAA